MKRKACIVLLLFLNICLLGCIKNIKQNQTIESSHIDPIESTLKYSFTRNQRSSVDYSDAQQYEYSIFRMYDYYIKKANFDTRSLYHGVITLFQNTNYNFKVKDMVANSEVARPVKALIENDIITLIDSSASIAGMPADSARKIREQGTDKAVKYFSIDGARKQNDAASGKAGKIGALRIQYGFADDKGWVIAEVFKNIMLGCIYLDQMFNVHLNPKILNSNSLQSKHEKQELINGTNYTELEHHWDMAYGYYQYWKILIKDEDLPILKGLGLKLNNAFVRGRTALNTRSYDELQKQAKLIRSMMALALGARIIDLLVGKNTLANLRQEPRSFAFLLLSQAMGFIYDLQFLPKPDGNSMYYTYQEIKEIWKKFQDDNGFWNNQRLIADFSVNGSLLWIAKEIANRIGITLDQAGIK